MSPAMRERSLSRAWSEIAFCSRSIRSASSQPELTSPAYWRTHRPTSQGRTTPLVSISSRVSQPQSQTEPPSSGAATAPSAAIPAKTASAGRACSIRRPVR